MLRTTAIVAAIFATVGAACGGTSDRAPEPVGTSEARVTLSATGTGSTSETLTATSVASGEITYVFSVQAYNAAHTVLQGSGSLTASLAVATTTDLKLATAIAASGSAQVQGQASVAPSIVGFEVDLPGQGSLSGTTQGDVLAAVHVDALSSVQGDLSFFWSGFGIQGAVEGSSTVDLSAAAAAQATGPAVVRVVVQDALGDTAEASVTLDLTASASGSASGSASVDAGVSASGSSNACLDADAQCNATCDAALTGNPLAVTAHTSCVASCSVALASCGL